MAYGTLQQQGGIDSIMRTRSGLRIIGWLASAIVACVIVVCVLAWLSLRPLAIAASRPILAPYNTEIVSIEGLALGTTSLSVGRIDLQVRDADGIERAGEIQDVRVTFSLRGLLNRQVERVSVGSIMLEALPALPASDSAPLAGEDATNGRLRLETLALLVRELPLTGLEIGHLSIAPYTPQGSVAITRSQRELQARVAVAQAQIDLRMNWHDDDFVSSHFLSDHELPDTVSPRALTGSLRIDHAQDNAATVEFSVDEVDGMLAFDLSTQLQVSAIQRLLQDLQIIPAWVDEGDYRGLLLATITAREQPQTDGDPLQRLDFELTLQENSALAAPLPAYPGASTASFDWQSNGPLALAGSWRPQSGAVLFNGSWQPIDITVVADGEQKLFRIGLHQLALDCSGSNAVVAAAGGATCTFLQSSDVQMQDFAIGDLVLEDVRAITNSTLDSGTVTSLRMGPGSRVAIGHASAAGIELIDANFLVQDAVTVVIDEDGVVDLSGNGLELYLPDLRVAETTVQAVLNASNFRAHIPVEGAPAISAELGVRDIGIDPLPVTPRRPEFTAQVALFQDQLGVDGVLRAAGIPLLEIGATHGLSSGVGSARLQIPTLQFDELFTNLSQLFIEFPYPADFIDGSVGGSSELQWQLGEQTRAEGTLRLDLEGLSGYYQEIALVDLDAVVAGRLSEKGFVSDGRQAVSIASIDPGMPISNIAFDYQLDTISSLLTVEGLRANMFNGSIAASDIHFDIADVSTDFELQLQAIDLTRILSLAAYDGVRATGLFSGRIPISIDNGTIAVADGSVTVQPPGGSIRYLSPTGPNTGNVSLDLVNQALSNYQYDVLQAEVDYLPDGELSLAMQLQGGNPDMGQRINLNLNISDNIPALLQSLQASRNITDAVREGLENRQQNSQTP